MNKLKDIMLKVGSISAVLCLLSAVLAMCFASDISFTLFKVFALITVVAVVIVSLLGSKKK